MPQESDDDPLTSRRHLNLLSRSSPGSGVAPALGRSYLWFDHPLIEAWLEREAHRLRPRLTREHTPPPDDGVLQGLELARIEARPDIAREPIEGPAAHSPDEPAPALNDHGRR